MSKGIRSYPESIRDQVVQRRMRSKTGGLGYLAAAAYYDKQQAVIDRARHKLMKSATDNQIKRGKHNGR
jgi:hypothetical protein